MQGDSGGGLVVRGGAGGYSLVGVTSWGDGCNLSNTFGVYTRVAAARAWVANTLGYSGVQ